MKRVLILMLLALPVMCVAQKKDAGFERLIKKYYIS